MANAPAEASDWQDRRAFPEDAGIDPLATRVGAPSVWVRITEHQQRAFEERFDGPIVLGRQKREGRVSELLFEVGRDEELGCLRLAIAPHGERHGISRRHLLIEPMAGNRVRLTNLSDRVPIPTTDGRGPLRPGESGELDLPLSLNLGSRSVQLLSPPEDDPLDSSGMLQSLSQVSRPPGCGGGPIGEQLRRLQEQEGREPGSGLVRVGPEAVAHWFQATIAVLQDAACTPDFFHRAAEAMVEYVGLSNGWALTWDEAAGDWVEQVHHRCAGDPATSRPSRSLLERIRQSRTTTWIAPECGPEAEASLARMQVAAAVASPILGRGGEVIGALYGDRGPDASGPARFTRLEALLVELLAGGVAAGLARQSSEAEAARRRVQFEMFFSSDLAQALEMDPALLEARTREATVMFGDVRGFSRLSEALGPECTCALVNDVMDAVTEQVREHGGVIVDYIGDGFIALWNAPADQPDHAAMACRAALGIQRAVPAISDRWVEQMGRPLAVGIGINTGPVTVGNTGSKSRFKYGPLGHTVNLASRVEGATKHFGVPVLVTGAVRERVGPEFGARRLATVRLVGIETTVELIELHEADDPEWSLRREHYEQALRHFEAARFADCCRALYGLLEGQEGRYDGPSLNLLATAVQYLKTPPPEPFDPTVALTTK